MSIHSPDHKPQATPDVDQATSERLIADLEALNRKHADKAADKEEARKKRNKILGGFTAGALVVGGAFIAGRLVSGNNEPSINTPPAAEAPPVPGEVAGEGAEVAEQLRVIDFETLQQEMPHLIVREPLPMPEGFLENMPREQIEFEANYQDDKVAGLIALTSDYLWNFGHVWTEYRDDPSIDLEATLREIPAPFTDSVDSPAAEFARGFMTERLSRMSEKTLEEKAWTAGVCPTPQDPNTATTPFCNMTTNGATNLFPDTRTVFWSTDYVDQQNYPSDTEYYTQPENMPVVFYEATLGVGDKGQLVLVEK